ncbi:early nodulin-like protein 2 [Iris pallida]|uniref:Early nodulin-like protein 2 n=1 Tax=Iris pallida TaxID=29817 RepID=A0AAX6EXW8_IRIPA|nr:early nodulin-like protein 2 [Iris pallida]KAJ6815393.1 early nodulin-like protein 2 [Iris pallida]
MVANPAATSRSTHCSRWRGLLLVKVAGGTRALAGSLDWRRRTTVDGFRRTVAQIWWWTGLRRWPILRQI